MGMSLLGMALLKTIKSLNTVYNEVKFGESSQGQTLHTETCSMMLYQLFHRYIQYACVCILFVDLLVLAGVVERIDLDCCFLIRDSCNIAKSLSPHLKVKSYDKIC